MTRLSFFVCLVVAATVNAFAPSTQHHFQRARLISGSTTFRDKARFMSNDDSNSEAPVSKAPQGTFYDDEVGILFGYSQYECGVCHSRRFDPQVNPDSYAPKVGISDSMRERLKREASRGLDSEQKQTNIILYISIAVAVLVVAGGSGILY